MCRCDGAVFEAEKLTVKEDVYHKRCFTCHRCSRALDSLIVMTSTDGNIYCKVCYKIVHAPDRPQVMTDLAVIPAEEEKDGCPRCTGKVRVAALWVNIPIFWNICLAVGAKNLL